MICSNSPHFETFYDLLNLSLRHVIINLHRQLQLEAVTPLFLEAARSIDPEARIVCKSRYVRLPWDREGIKDRDFEPQYDWRVQLELSHYSYTGRVINHLVTCLPHLMLRGQVGIETILPRSLALAKRVRSQMEGARRLKNGIWVFGKVSQSEFLACLADLEVKLAECSQLAEVVKGWHLIGRSCETDRLSIVIHTDGAMLEVKPDSANPLCGYILYKNYDARDVKRNSWDVVKLENGADETTTDNCRGADYADKLMEISDRRTTGTGVLFHESLASLFDDGSARMNPFKEFQQMLTKKRGNKKLREGRRPQFYNSQFAKTQFSRADNSKVERRRTPRPRESRINVILVNTENFDRRKDEWNN